MLKYVADSHTRFHTFVANRLSHIQVVVLAAKKGGQCVLVTRAILRICGNESRPSPQLVEKLATLPEKKGKKVLNVFAASKRLCCLLLARLIP